MDYDREIDPSIPACVALIESSPCDKCDNGDFGSETWYDGDGNEVIPPVQGAEPLTSQALPESEAVGRTGGSNPPTGASIC